MDYYFGKPKQLPATSKWSGFDKNKRLCKSLVVYVSAAQPPAEGRVFDPTSGPKLYTYTLNGVLNKDFRSFTQ